MAFQKLTIRPGINTMATPTANEGGWSQSNLVRYRQGFLEKVGGWGRLFSGQAAGVVRCLYAYQDLQDNKNLLIGGDGGLQVYVVPANTSAPSLIVVRLARRTATLYAATVLDTISGTSASATITIHDPGHGAAIGDQVALPIKVSIGQRLIAPQNVIVATVPDANHWTFVNSQALLANSNTSGSYGTTPVFTVTTAEQNTETVRVTLPYHGLAIAGTFEVQYAVVWQTYGGTLSVPAGTYAVASVIDGNTFTLSTVGLLQTGLSAGAEFGISEQTPPTIYGSWNLVYYSSVG